MVTGTRTHDDHIAAPDGSSATSGVQTEKTLPGVRLKTLEVTQELRSSGGRHERCKHRIAESVLTNPVAKDNKVMTRRRGDAPQVNLKNPARRRRSLPGGVRTVCSCEVTAGVQGGIIDGLEYGDIECPRSARSERQTHSHEDISKTLDAYAECASTSGCRCDGIGRIVRYINAAIGIDDNSLHKANKSVKIEGPVDVDTARKGHRRQGADSGLQRSSHLDNLRAEIGRPHYAQMIFIVAT